MSPHLLETANGIRVERGRLLVAGFGPNLDPVTFRTEHPGRVLRIDVATKRVEPVSDRIGNLDGIERYGTDLLVSDFWGAQIMRVHPDRTAEQVMRVLPSAADIGWDASPGILAVPEMAANVVSFHEL